MVPKVLRGQRWKTLKRVKLFTPHKLKFKNGKEIVVDDAEIERIKDEMNKAAEADQLATASQDHILTVGEDGKVRSKSSKDINLLGYWHNYRVERSRDRSTGKTVPWVIADFFCDPEKEKIAKEHPFISVEYHPDQHRFSNVAFTKLKPMLDVGVITPYHWQRGELDADGAGRMAAYSIEGLTNTVVVYSSERSTMPTELETVTEKIDSGFNRLADILSGKFSPPSPALTPAQPVAPVVPAAPAALSYGALATGGASATAPNDTEKELSALKRKLRLQELAKTKKVNIDVEMEEWKDQPDSAFDKHANAIAACYASVNSGGATVTPLDAPGGGKPTAERIAQVQRNIAQRGGFANYESVAARLLVDPTWDGSN